MSKLQVIKASAGSGKTHYLTGFFLGIIFRENSDYFRNILAVTFTNKATEEMKGRIIEQLDVLRRGDPSAYMPDLLELKPDFTEAKIRNKAGFILEKILHDYSWFTIQTIDTFFQRIIKAFTREIGIPGNYTVELDTRPALQYAVDTLIDSIEDKSPILQWLIRFSEEKILEGKAWNVHSDLLRLGEELFKEGFVINAPKILPFLNEKENLDKFRGKLHAKFVSIENEIVELSKDALTTIAENGLDRNDFFQKGRGIVTYLERLARKEIDLPSSYVLKLLDGPEYWPASDSPKKEEIINLASADLLPSLINIIDFLQINLPTYFTSKEILINVYSLGILSDISSKVTQYRQEKNAFILSDAPAFIHRIIDDNETPFIYEKIGNRYRHFLIDEFQDTSILQWSNFKPLIENSLASGKESLLVGDVKQSIYRWRNGDWEILASGVADQFPKSQLVIKNLETNWRSKEFVTKFNGSFFSSLTHVMQNQLSELLVEAATELPDYSSVLSTVYQDVMQRVPEHNTGGGRVEIRFFERNYLRENPEYLEDVFLNQIKQLLDSGYNPGDIAILVRGSKEGQHLAKLLIEKDSERYFKQRVGVISNESLFINASNAVNLVVAAIKFLILPSDAINCGKLINSYCVHRKLSDKKEDPFLKIVWETESTTDEGLRSFLPVEFISQSQRLIALPLYDLAEHLIRIFSLEDLLEEVPFLHALLDLVHEFVQTNASDPEKFLDFWEEEGKIKSIPAAEAQNALRIVTIHKSKGLEFPAVLIPYCNWAIDQKANTILWAKPSSDEFEYLPVYPINYGKNLKRSYFAEAYYDELFKSYIDNLNLLYVAFTRAVDTLIVYAQIGNPEKIKSPVGAIGDLVYQSLTNLEKDFIDRYFDAESNTFQYGDREVKKSSQSDAMKNEIMIRPAEGEPVTERLFFHPGGYDFFSDRQKQTDQITLKGTVLHAVLSKVIEEGEFEAALLEAFYAGLLNQEEQVAMLEHIKKGLEDKRVKNWFDGSGEVLNESEILLSSGESKRPDRVILFPDRAVVVDYKFGSGEQVNRHRKQVNKYKNLLEEMGYSSVEGYLWYINENQIIEV